MIDERSGDKIVKGHLNTRGLFEMTPERYAALYTEAMRLNSLPEEITNAYGVNFKEPKAWTIYQVLTSEALLPREIFNADSEDFICRNDILKMNIEAAIHVMHFDGALGDRYIRIPVGEWKVIPHGFYQIGVKSGNEFIKATINYGTIKGKGEKNQLRPDIKPVRGVL